MSAPRTGRRAALAALPMAITGATSAHAAPSPVLRQALNVARLYEIEGEAVHRFGLVEHTPDEFAADDAVAEAFVAWDAGMMDLAAMPAGDRQDMLVKLALVLRALRDGPAEAESAMADSVLRDMWRLTPELRPLLRWKPDPGAGNASPREVRR